MKTSSDWLSEAWSAADMHAQRLLTRLAGGPTGSLLILPVRQRRRTASGRLLAAILAGIEHAPATVVCEPTIIPGLRRALDERLATARPSIVDWCHPAPAAPADLTILEPGQLRRSQATIGGYHARAIAVLTGDATWSERDLSALAAVMDAAPNPLIVVEEWADPEVIATAVARIARVTPNVARDAVTSWREHRIEHGGLHTARTGDMARDVLSRCAPAYPNAA